MPAIAGAAGGNLDVGAIISKIVGGGAGGAILTVIAGLVKNMVTSQQTH
jgi:fucose permease